MPFIRRFTDFPNLATLLEIEAVDIIDLNAPQLRQLTGVGTVCVVGEFLKGDYATPTEVAGGFDISSKFGTYRRVSSGEDEIIPPAVNGFLAVSQRTFRRLVLTRVDMRVGALTQTDVGTVDVELNNSSAADVAVTIPAGTRISDNVAIGSATEVFAVDGDYETVVPALGSVIVTVNVFTVKETANPVLAGTNLFVNDDAFATDAGLTLTSPVPAHTQLEHLVAATIDSRYQAAFDSTIGGALPVALINYIFASRESDAIRTALKLNAVTASQQGRGRTAITKPPVGTTKGVAQGSVAPGVGANRADRNVYAYPWVKFFSPDAAQTVTVGFDGFVASLCSVLGPEQNIGQETDFLGAITGFEDGIGADQFTMNDYIAFKAAGIAAARFDVDLGKFVVQSDVTSDLTNTSLKRRRMADFIEDSLAVIDAQFSKKLMTVDRRNARAALHNQFLLDLLSAQNPPAQKIAAFQVDEKNGNTPERLAAGIHTLIDRVQLLSSMDALVIQAEIGEGVTITEQ